jgi:hypothetical protein
VAETPDVLAPLKLHYPLWLLFEIKGDTYFMYQGIFDTDLTSTSGTPCALFASTGITTVFHGARRVPENWQGNVPAWNSFPENINAPASWNAEYPYATADEVKKALRVKGAMSTMLDQMQ